MLQIAAPCCSLPCREQLHRPGHAVHRVVGQLLAAGQHSPRLMALVALQLTVAWVAAPTIALHYAAELEQLLLMDVGHHNSNKEVI